MLHHVEIYVSDLTASFRFYSWLLPKLGYSVYQQWPKGFSFKYDRTYIVFVQTEDRFKDIPYHRSHTGLNHLAFHAETRESVDKLTSELKDYGVEILYEDKHPFAGGPDYYAVFFEDPDRIKLEIVAP